MRSRAKNTIIMAAIRRLRQRYLGTIRLPVSYKLFQALSFDSHGGGVVILEALAKCNPE